MQLYPYIYSISPSSPNSIILGTNSKCIIVSFGILTKQYQNSELPWCMAEALLLYQFDLSVKRQNTECNG